MKSFVISLSVLSVIIAAIVLNCIYINNVTDSLIFMTENLTKEEESIKQLSEKWDKEKFCVCISTTHRATDDVEKNIEILKTKIEKSNFDDFEEYKKMLIIALEEVKKVEEVSLNAIF